MNRALRRISIAVLVMFVLLLININYLQGFEPASLATKPNNARAFEAQFQYQRGSIVTSDGVTIAESTPSSDVYKFQRKYPHGAEYAPVTGYDTLYSETGIEYYENTVLNGSDSSLTVRNFIDLLTGKPRKGANVTLTINSRAQDAAWNALQNDTNGKPGAVVALNPQTGAILAMASYPSYDPNVLATHSGTKLNAADKALLQQAGNPLLNRAINFTWPPGSTFKIVTSSAYLAQNPNSTPQTNVDSPTQLKLPQTTHVLTNNNGEVCGNGSGQVPLITAFAQSCDTTFGSIGMNLKAPTLNNFAELFGMNSKKLRIPMPVTQSNYVIPPSQALTAFSAIGQYSDTVTPLQEAMFAASIANGGKLMTPYLVRQVTASDLSTVQTTSPAELSQAVSPTVATDLGQMMLAVVQEADGTANAFNTAAVGFTMAGKTGTAQNGVNNTNLNDAVFTCYAPYDNPQIAVGVIIQGGGYGATAAAPIAVQVIKAYLASLGKS
ncbi:MAG TPA: penicillin-binding protein 2 [Streptosporangiaceae bacterium]|nr:penicillin-binding protein 2 [Streptosporangiaceae bacterium]